ncbi:hypothetical protein AGMMS50239_39590 [Bacteroidia bacterium]|nr:hypothetical protein AGMMS50239_39590 [Bacteroidia bacterium]
MSLKPIEQSEGKPDDEPENVLAPAAAKSHEAKPQFVSPKEEEKHVAIEQIHALFTSKSKPQDIVHKEFREMKETILIHLKESEDKVEFKEAKSQFSYNNGKKSALGYVTALA